MTTRWTNILKALGNRNRLRIVAMLLTGQSLDVSYISKELKISPKSTSKHLGILRNLDVLDYAGRHGHVFYCLSSQLPADIHQIIKVVFKL